MKKVVTTPALTPTPNRTNDPFVCVQGADRHATVDVYIK